MLPQPSLLPRRRPPNERPEPHLQRARREAARPRCARRRVEDARFIQGKGHYVDDIKMPGMLFGDFVRSPYGHARIRSIDIQAALKVPGVKAILTANDLSRSSFTYMPTLAGDVQAVLADAKVLFQGQKSPSSLPRAAMPQPTPSNSSKSIRAAARSRRSLQGSRRGCAAPARRHQGQDDGPAWAAQAPQPHLHLGSRRQDRDRCGHCLLRSGRRGARQLSARPSLSHRDCGCVASFDKINGKLTVWGTFQPPCGADRRLAHLQHPEHNIRIVSPDIGGGFGNKVGVYPGYICAIVASIVTGVPVKWIEDRIENLTGHRVARDYHMTGRIGATTDGRITALDCDVLADHGAFDACADPTKYPAGFFNICTGSYDIPVAHLLVDGVYTNKAPGGVAYRCSFRVTEPPISSSG